MHLSSAIRARGVRRGRGQRNLLPEGKLSEGLDELIGSRAQSFILLQILEVLLEP